MAAAAAPHLAASPARGVGARRPVPARLRSSSPSPQPLADPPSPSAAAVGVMRATAPAHGPSAAAGAATGVSAHGRCAEVQVGWRHCAHLAAPGRSSTSAARSADHDAQTGIGWECGADTRDRPCTIPHCMSLRQSRQLCKPAVVSAAIASAQQQCGDVVEGDVPHHQGCTRVISQPTHWEHDAPPSPPVHPPGVCDGV